MLKYTGIYKGEIVKDKIVQAKELAKELGIELPAVMTSVWVFHENYPGVGAALVDGPAIVAIKDASQELIDSCPEAIEWLKGKF